ncbi:MAG: reverse transcriptase family protein, partial [Candidatus Thiodiazotropha endolucinida]|nr:reverse transcriptase family protein [Candidatus Thiodiazotropha taylori]MCW4272705.1 reverse transcriptase family protein [Candidatus Thiodiazotropha endolucinida]
LQGGFQKQRGCLFTSFLLRESIAFARENNSKLYVCFLDLFKAFDNVWHYGLFYKLYQCGIRGYVYKAIVDLYNEMKSCVKYKGCTSSWFPILQGTRQGGVLSPFLFTIFINELIVNVKNSEYGLHIYHMNVSCPTLADDMFLASLSKYGLSSLLDICQDYYTRWRLKCNASKCSVIVFNESKADYKKTLRTWKIGPDVINEAEEYRHLGIVCNKYSMLDENIHQSSLKLKNTLLGLINCGIYENGLHPINSKRLYNAVVLPAALYGCELWNGLSSNQVELLEISHRFCIKYMQSLPSRTRTDVALGLLGCYPIISEIDYKKLIFLGQLCSFSSTCITKDLFSHRLINYLGNPMQKIGFFPDILRTLDKYSLRYVIDIFICNGTFMSKYPWKRLVKNRIDYVVREEWLNRVSKDIYLSKMLFFHNLYEPCKFWKISKLNSRIAKQCQNCVKLIGLMFSNYNFLSCAACGMLNNNQTEHIILYCSATERIRKELWQTICRTFGFDVFSRFKLLQPADQIVSLFSFLDNIANDAQHIEQFLNTLIRLLDGMAKLSTFKNTYYM